jgi:hypothetical protein
MCFPANIPFLKFNRKDHLWNIFFAAGLFGGRFIGGVLFISLGVLMTTTPTAALSIFF